MVIIIVMAGTIRPSSFLLFQYIPSPDMCLDKTRTRYRGGENIWRTSILDISPQSRISINPSHLGILFIYVLPVASREALRITIPTPISISISIESTVPQREGRARQDGYAAVEVLYD